MTKILDCTLRDGGHVNNWEFSDECILKTIETAENSGIEYIEVGYTMPECVKSSKTKLVVMIDTKNIRPVSRIADFVRVACYPDQIRTALKALKDYKNRGFGVFLHLMTADKFEDWKSLKGYQDVVESIYFADTFGAFFPSDVERVYHRLEGCGFERISFHGHNNLQLAFANTIRAIELGAYSVDGSVYGMGRGGGNLPLELILRYLDRDNSHYLELIKDFYNDLHKKYGWGYSYEALISGLKNIHP